MSDREWLVPVTIIVAVELIFWLAAWLDGYAATPMLTTYGVTALAVFTIALGGSALLAIWRERPSSPIAHLRQLTVDNRNRLLVAAIGSQLLALGSAAFGSLKAAIPRISPFWFDLPLEKLEISIWGAPAWQMLNSAIGWSVPLFDHLYGTFVITHVLAVLGLLCMKPSSLKTRALISLATAWFVLGTAGAFLLSSAGPAFVSRVYGVPSQIDAMLGRDAPLTVMTVNALWSAHETGVPMFGNGISAMPSMHVALTLSLALLLNHTRFAIVGWLYFVLVWIGSVLLGWHWFADGLVGSAGMLVLWRAAPKLAASASGRRFGRLRPRAIAAK